MWLQEIYVFVAFLSIPIAVTALLENRFADRCCPWYRGLRKPRWIAPDNVFLHIWIILFVSMGLASYIVWKTNEQPIFPLFLYSVTLVLTWTWTPIFFGLKSTNASLILIAFLLPTADFCTYVFFEANLVAGLLMAPYPIWLIYITYLNYSLYYLNKD